jgi:hypothetical protein
MGQTGAYHRGCEAGHEASPSPGYDLGQLNPKYRGDCRQGPEDRPINMSQLIVES